MRVFVRAKACITLLIIISATSTNSSDGSPSSSPPFLFPPGSYIFLRIPPVNYIHVCPDAAANIPKIRSLTLCTIPYDVNGALGESSAGMDVFTCDGEGPVSALVVCGDK